MDHNKPSVAYPPKHAPAPSHPLPASQVFAVWIFSAGFAASVIVKIATVTRRLPLPFALAGKAVAAALFGALIFSGFLGAWREMMNNAKVYDDLDFDVSRKGKGP